MADTFVIDASEIYDLARNCDAAARLVPQEMLRAMTRSVIDVEGDARRIVNTEAKDTGNLARSLTHEAKPTGFGVVGRVGSNLPYSEVVHEGREPGGFPPPGVLLGWMGRRGIPLGRPPTDKFPYYSIEYLVARKINSRKGKAIKFFDRALAAKRAAIDREFAQVPKRILAKLGGR